MRSLLPALVAAALLAAGCGGSDKSQGVKPKTWASTVCTSLGSWERDLKTGAAGLDKTLPKAAASRGLARVRGGLAHHPRRTPGRAGAGPQESERARTPAGH